MREEYRAGWTEDKEGNMKNPAMEPGANRILCGKPVMLVDIVSKPELNGCFGHVLGPEKKQGHRFGVRVHTKGGDAIDVALLAKNLNLRHFQANLASRCDLQNEW